MTLTAVAATPIAFAADTHANASDHAVTGTSGTSGTATQSQPTSKADQNSGGANGQCPGGAYCSTRDGSPSANGNGGGKATGKPCAGCVGKADNKNPAGQAPNGSDANAGYECDRNHGIGRTNPAHTGCSTATTDCTATPTAAQCVKRVENCTTLPDLPGCVTGSSECAATVGTTCTAVLGEMFTRAPTATPPAKVLGETFSRTPTAALPFTGSNVALLVGFALMSLTAGAAMALVGRRRPMSAS